MTTQTEENYLKAIYKISEEVGVPVSTNSIAKALETSAASVSDMIQKLSKKKLINYKKHKGVKLSKSGEKLATALIRKHRLWEVFLTNKLNFAWDEVHEMAEQLEHIKSEELITRLDAYLDFPKFDPHGDPIPDANGKIPARKQIPLSELKAKQEGIVVGVQTHTKPFLQYLDKLNIALGSTICMIEKQDFDESIKVKINNEKKTSTLSHKVAKNVFIQIN